MSVIENAIADLMTEKFYVIKMINTNSGQRGYLFDSPEGIQVITGGISSAITQFPTYQAAQRFIREHKLERGGIKAYIRDSEDFVKDEANSVGMSKADKPLFYLEDMLGAKCCFDSKLNDYFFKPCSIGYCCWETEADAKEFIDRIQSGFTLPIIVKKLEPKK